MIDGTRIAAVTARQVFSSRGHPGVEATITTANGAVGSAIVAWITVGGYIDLRRLFKDLSRVERNADDDGTVVGEQLLVEVTVAETETPE